MAVMSYGVRSSRSSSAAGGKVKSVKVPRGRGNPGMPGGRVKTSTGRGGTAKIPNLRKTGKALKAKRV
jgi:hypothetical protein